MYLPGHVGQFSAFKYLLFAVCSEHSPLVYVLQNQKQNKDVHVVEFMYFVFTWAGGTVLWIQAFAVC